MGKTRTSPRDLGFIPDEDLDFQEDDIDLQADLGFTPEPDEVEIGEELEPIQEPEPPTPAVNEPTRDKPESQSLLKAFAGGSASSLITKEPLRLQEQP